MRPLLKNRPLLFSFVAASTSLYAYKRSRQYSHTLHNLLDYYGFKTEEQKQALRYLMKQSGIKNTDQLLDQKSSSLKEVGEVMLELVRQTQTHFTGRSGNQERWDVKTVDWQKDSTQQRNILKALQTVEMIDEIPQALTRTDIVCILGATNAIMQMRLAYADELMNQNKLSAQYLVMLAGERYLKPDNNGFYVDGPEQALTQLANTMAKDLRSLTETDLMRNAYKHSSLYQRFLENAVLIDTQRRDLPRPTTETTVLELCEWLRKHPTLSSISFISNQPYVLYQKEVIERVFKTQNLSNIKIQVIGPKFNAEMEMLNNSADIIKCILQDLGSRIWAATPNVLCHLNIDMTEPSLEHQYKDIYKKMPLVFHKPAEIYTIMPGDSLSFS